MKKLIVWSLVISMCALLLTACGNGQEASRGNYTDEMKIPYAVDLSPEDGADSVERAGDHVDSPYFSRLDFYNMTSTDTRKFVVTLPYAKEKIEKANILELKQVG